MRRWWYECPAVVRPDGRQGRVDRRARPGGRERHVLLQLPDQRHPADSAAGYADEVVLPGLPQHAERRLPPRLQQHRARGRRAEVRGSLGYPVARRPRRGLQPELRRELRRRRGRRCGRLQRHAAASGVRPFPDRGRQRRSGLSRQWRGGRRQRRERHVRPAPRYVRQRDGDERRPPGLRGWHLRHLPAEDPERYPHQQHRSGHHPDPHRARRRGGQDAGGRRCGWLLRNAAHRQRPWGHQARPPRRLHPRRVHDPRQDEPRQRQHAARALPRRRPRQRLPEPWHVLPQRLRRRDAPDVRAMRRLGA